MKTPRCTDRCRISGGTQLQPVIEIGSNDATLLRACETAGRRRIGIDPTARKFARYYTDGIDLGPDFFSAAAFRARFPWQQARVVASIAMFYDLEDPAACCRASPK